MISAWMILFLGLVMPVVQSNYYDSTYNRDMHPEDDQRVVRSNYYDSMYNQDMLREDDPRVVQSNYYDSMYDEDMLREDDQKVPNSRIYKEFEERDYPVQKQDPQDPHSRIYQEDENNFLERDDPRDNCLGDIKGPYKEFKKNSETYEKLYVMRTVKKFELLYRNRRYAGKAGRSCRAAIETNIKSGSGTYSKSNIILTYDPINCFFKWKDGTTTIKVKNCPSRKMTYAQMKNAPYKELKERIKCRSVMAGDYKEYPASGNKFSKVVVKLPVEKKDLKVEYVYENKRKYVGFAPNCRAYLNKYYNKDGYQRYTRNYNVIYDPDNCFFKWNGGYTTIKEQCATRKLTLKQMRNTPYKNEVLRNCVDVMPGLYEDYVDDDDRYTYNKKNGNAVVNVVDKKKTLVFSYYNRGYTGPIGKNCAVHIDGYFGSGGRQKVNYWVRYDPINCYFKWYSGNTSIKDECDTRRISYMQMFNTPYKKLG